MTYCCGILVRDGLVMVADTRTNAGLDNISTFRKLHLYHEPGERIMALASSGNLSLSQTVRSTLTEGVENPATGEREPLLNSPPTVQGRRWNRPRSNTTSRFCSAARSGANACACS